MSQSRRMSFLESAVNIVVGFWLAVGVQILVFPVFGLTIPISHDLAIAGIFTITSIARSYCIRRAFNNIGGRG